MVKKGLYATDLIALMGFTFVVILLIFAIIYPVFVTVPQRHGHSSCSSELRQLGLSILQYTQDYDETYPYSGAGHDWPDESSVYFAQLVMPYIKSERVFLCPSDPMRTHGSLYEALSAAGRSPSVPIVPTSYYYLYDFCHADMGINGNAPCTAGPIRPAKVAEVLHPDSKALMVCILSGQYVSSTAAYSHGPHDQILFADGHVKRTPIARVVENGCFPPRNLDWSGMGAVDVK